MHKTFEILVNYLFILWKTYRNVRKNVDFVMKIGNLKIVKINFRGNERFLDY